METEEDCNTGQVRRLAAARQDRLCCRKGVKFKCGDEQRCRFWSPIYTVGWHQRRTRPPEIQQREKGQIR